MQKCELFTTPTREELEQWINHFPPAEQTALRTLQGMLYNMQVDTVHAYQNQIETLQHHVKAVEESYKKLEIGKNAFARDIFHLKRTNEAMTTKVAIMEKKQKFWKWPTK